MNELKPCPFCGRGGSIRIKTQIESFEYRDEGKVKLYLDGMFDGYGFPTHWRHRFGFQAYCGSCHVKTPYFWSWWHDEYKEGIRPKNGKRRVYPRRDCYDESKERGALDACIAAWNKRTS